MRAALLVVTALAMAGAVRPAPAASATLGKAGALGQASFTASRRAEALATITVRCDECAWDTAGREAVVLAIAVDGRYAQHLPVVRRGRADYRVLLGSVEPGPHSVRIDADPELTAGALRGGGATVDAIVVTLIDEASADYRAVSRAPIVYARPDTVGRFTDVPVFMWYEIEPSARGTRYRYSVVFTNEDGGTPADGLMARWGRTTDIEYLYSVEVDGSGEILDEDIQGPKHEILPFRGTREGRHPLLWVSTENNMVLDSGATRVRYGPAPVAFPLPGVSREAVMDAHPWLYVVMAHELAREGKIVPGSGPGQGTVPDPRRFLYVEACGELSGRALAFAVRAGTEWIASDRGIPEYRITRDGCFRGAIPLPAGTGVRDVRALRVQVFDRPPADDAPPPSPGPARVTRINTVFMLDEGFRPGAPLLRWAGEHTLVPGGPPFELALR